MVRVLRNAARILLSGVHGVAVELGALGVLLAIAAIIALAVTRLF